MIYFQNHIKTITHCFFWIILLFQLPNIVSAQSVNIHPSTVLNPIVLNQHIPYSPYEPYKNNLYPQIPNTSFLRMSKLQATFNNQQSDWEVSFTITDIGDERLFKNLFDINNVNGTTLRQAPARHFWLGLQRRF